MTSGAKNVAEPSGQLQSVEDWLRQLDRGSSVSNALHRVIQAAIQSPDLASYASAVEMADKAGVNTASVTRAAQSLGFVGWPDLRQEIRARYVGQLTAPELAVVHDARSTGQPFDDALGTQIAQLKGVQRALDRSRAKAFAKAIATAARRVVVANGSFAGVGRILAHHCGVAGYASEFYDDAVATANGVSRLGPGDVLVVITHWRIYASTIIAAREARAKGATVCLISDVAHSPIAELAHHLLVVPSEGTSFFPALVPTLSVIEGLCSELESVDPERTRRSVSEAEEQWQKFGLLHFNSRP